MQHGADVAIAAHERLRHPLDQRRRRIVGHEVNLQFPRNESGAGGLRDDQADRILDFAESLARDRVSEKSLRAEVMPGGVEFEGTAANIQSLHLGLEVGVIADIDAHSCEHSSKLLYILLRVSSAHAECVQLQ